MKSREGIALTIIPMNADSRARANTIKPRRASTASRLLAAGGLALLGLAVQVRADNTPQTLPFSQNWSVATLITTANDWSGVPGFVGYRGDDLTTLTTSDCQTNLTDGTSTPVNVLNNQSAPNTTSAGGLAEFDGIANPVVALQGSGTADAPFLLLNLNTTGKQNILVAYLLRDIDGSTDDAVQQMALHFRIGNSGSWTNVAAAYVADATTGPSLATLTTPVSVTLPASANNQSLVQIRWMTANAAGNDEWVGIDDISVTGDPLTPSNPTGVGAATPATVIAGNATLLTVTVTPGANPTSTGLTVTGDLSSIGGSPTQTFYDDATHGDVTLGDNIFSFNATVTGGTTPGAKSLGVSIADAQARTGSASIALTVTSAATPPSITTPPAGQTVWAGTNATFTVAATGTAPLAYQWRFNTVPLTDQTNTTLALSNLLVGQSGNYDVVVTNLAGTVTSAAAVLTLRAPIATNIAGLRALVDAVNYLPVDTTNLYQIEGVVTTHTNLTTAGNALFYIQDATAGIAIFVSGSTTVRPFPGDVVRVVGPLGHFNGLLELNLVAANPTHSVVTNSSGNPLPTPLPILFSATNDILNTETNLEGRLVVLSNVFLDVTAANFPGAAGGNVILTNTSGELFTLRIDARTDIINLLKPPGAKSIVGVLSQNDTTNPRTSGYQILPSRRADIIDNHLPVAGDNGGATPEGVAFNLSLTKILANDSDADGDTLTVVSVSATSTNGGAVVLTSTNVIYTPLPAFTGTDRFTYTITDGFGATATATVEVLVLSGALPSGNVVSLEIIPTGVRVRFLGIPGRSYRVQRSTDLINWPTVSTITAPLHGLIEYLDTTPPPSAYYRTVTP